MLPDSMVGSSARRLRLRRTRGRVGLGLVAGLSVLAGMTDAIGFLATGDFVSFMSGNTTRLAVSLGEGDFGGLVRLSVALASFVVGNALGVILARFSGRRAAPILVCCAMLLALSAVWPFDWNVPALVAAILAMGMLNAVVEQVNGVEQQGRQQVAIDPAQRLAGATGALERHVRRRGARRPTGTATGPRGDGGERSAGGSSRVAGTGDSAAMADGLYGALSGHCGVCRVPRRPDESPERSAALLDLAWNHSIGCVHTHLYGVASR